MSNNVDMFIAFIIASVSFVVISCSDSSNNVENIVNYMDTPAGAKSSLPFLFSEGSEILMSWVESRGDSVTLRYASLVQDTWSDPVDIASGNDWFVNWADFPAIARNKDRILSHILKKSSEGTYSYDIKLNLLDDKNNSIQYDFPLHTDGTFTEHGFVSILPYKKNSFFLCWLDGRNTASGQHGGGSHNGSMTIRTAEVTHLGAVINENEIDDRVCDCCQTAAAITDNGPVVIYRDRSDEEIRDMSIVRWEKDKWTDPMPIFNDGWKIEGCPVNGPKADAMGNNLAIIWFTAAKKEPKVKLVFSSDGGGQFDEPIIISDINPAGRVDIAMVEKDKVLLSWLESVEAGNQLKVVQVHKSGRISESIDVAMLDGTRRSGFPQMELIGEKAVFAWTDIEQNNSKVNAAFIRLKNL